MRVKTARQEPRPTPLRSLRSLRFNPRLNFFAWLARWLVIQGQGRFFGGQTPQFFGIAHDGTGVWIRLRPRLQLGEKPVHVITRLGGQLIFGPPDFFKDGVRFHRFNLPQGQWACKSPATPARVTNTQHSTLNVQHRMRRENQIPAWLRHQVADDGCFDVNGFHALIAMQIRLYA